MDFDVAGGSTDSGKVALALSWRCGSDSGSSVGVVCFVAIVVSATVIALAAVVNVGVVIIVAADVVVALGAVNCYSSLLL